MIDTTHSLTPSERDVLFYTALGLYAREIAPIRGTSHNVIQNQRGSAILKLGVYSSIEAISLMMSIDQEFHKKVRKAVLSGCHKPDGKKGNGRRMGM